MRLQSHHFSIDLDLYGNKKIKTGKKHLFQYTVDVKGLRPFIKQLASTDEDDELWFSRLLLFLGGRASAKWFDVDRDGAIKKLEELSRRLIDLRVLQDHHLVTKSKFGDGFELIRLCSMRHGKTDHDEFVRIDESTKKYIQSRKEEFTNLLNELDGDESHLSMLADVIDEFLSAKGRNSTKEAQVLLEVVNESK